MAQQHLTLSPALLEIAREWLCEIIDAGTIKDVPPEEADDFVKALSDQEVERAIATHWDGGIETFINSNPVSSDQLSIGQMIAQHADTRHLVSRFIQDLAAVGKPFNFDEKGINGAIGSTTEWREPPLEELILNHLEERIDRYVEKNTALALNSLTRKLADGDRINVELVARALLLAQISVSLETISSWDESQRKQVLEWAYREYLYHSPKYLAVDRLQRPKYV